jgi:preprotein translocase subunit SecE
MEESMEIDGMRNKRSGASYIQDLKEELKKVSWTSQEELRFATKMVVMTTLFFGIGIYLVDFLIKGSLEMIRAVIHFIFG